MKATRPREGREISITDQAYPLERQATPTTGYVTDKIANDCFDASPTWQSTHGTYFFRSCGHVLPNTAVTTPFSIFKDFKELAFEWMEDK